QHVRGRDRQPVPVRGRDCGGGRDLGTGPCAYVKCVLPIFSPTVTTIRFQPTIVPRPSAIATAIFTQVGMNFVALSRAPLYALRFAISSIFSSLSMSFIKLRRASDARYMSLRVLPTASGGNFANEPYLVTWSETSRTSTAKDG